MYCTSPLFCLSCVPIFLIFSVLFLSHSPSLLQSPYYFTSTVPAFRIDQLQQIISHFSYCSIGAKSFDTTKRGAECVVVGKKSTEAITITKKENTDDTAVPCIQQKQRAMSYGFMLRRKEGKEGACAANYVHAAHILQLSRE